MDPADKLDLARQADRIELAERLQPLARPLVPRQRAGEVARPGGHEPEVVLDLSRRPDVAELVVQGGRPAQLSG